VARPLRITYPGAFYHVTARGNERKAVFRSTRDREKFLEYLATASQRYDAVVHAYCLMDNHYHLLLQTPAANLPQIMRHINGAYTTYFNVKRTRCGHLFQGRYKAILVDIDEYAKELSRYLHLNPVRAKLVPAPADYPWSSYRDYIGQRKAPDWLFRELILGYFGGNLSKAQKRYHDFVSTIAVDQAHVNPLDAVSGSTLLGSAAFISFVKESYLVGRAPDQNLPALKQLADRLSIPDICAEVEHAFTGQPQLARGIELYLCQKYTRMKLKEIGVYFGIGESGVCKAGRRVEKRMKSDRRLNKQIEALEKRITK